MFNTIRQGTVALAVLAPSRSGSTTALVAVILLAVLLAVVIWAAIWSSDPVRRKDALAVLDRLLRWKERR